MLYHLTSVSAWEAAQRAGKYKTASLEMEGFIHCSTGPQLLPVANAFYRDVEAPIVLWIDPEKLQAEVRWESPNPGDLFSEDRFPHLYGPLNLDAVVRVTEFQRDASGRFTRF